MNKKLHALYGLKWNPFSPELPTEALLVPAKVESFCWRVENSLVREGGFALISGDPGTGKSVVLAADGRLTDKLRRDELLPLGSRIRMRLAMEYASREELLACLTHLIERAGHPELMTEALKTTLCDHAAGNYRTLTTMAANLLTVAVERELPLLDEKLYFEVFTPDNRKPRRAGARP
jgi:type II secretory pathway predicted ATPase ExeA